MRIVYMGSPSYAALPLEHLLTIKGHEVVLVVSQPAKPVGRGNKEPVDPPVAALAKAKGLKVLQPYSAKDPSFLAELRGFAPDIIVTAAYGQILNEEFLAIPKRATINVHPSKLPHYRGATPVQSAILAGDQKTAITILFTVKKLDAGNIILSKDVAFIPGERAPDALERLFKEAGPLLVDAISLLADQKFQGFAQDEAQMTHCRKIEKEDGQVNWQLNAEEIYNRFRGYYGWPNSHTFFAKKRVILSALSVVDHSDQLPSEALKLSPGQFIFVKPLKSLVVRAADRYISISELKPEGGGLIDALAFANRLSKIPPPYQFD